MSDRLSELDAISRQRTLTTAESYELERELARANRRRVGWGLTKALARHGIKRSGRPVALPSQPPAGTCHE